MPGDLPVKSQTLMGRVNHLSSLMGCEALELCPSVCQQSPEEAGCSGGSVPGLQCVSQAVVCGCAFAHREQAGQLLCAFSSSLHARHRSARLWFSVAVGSCRLLCLAAFRPS